MTVVLAGVAGSLGGGRRLAVESLEVGPGERVVLYGPNGAGKSTLLRMLAGTLPAPPASRWEVPAAAYLPQRPYLFRGRADWNLRLGLDAAGASRATALAERFGVGGLAGRPARGLSGGERQRLALARVLARPEPLVLLDEPLAPLDARDRMAVARTVADALGDRAAVVVTHDHDEAAILGDRVAVMVDGSVRQVGPPDEVFALPADDEVAAVVGVGNVVTGVVASAEGGVAALRAGTLEIWGIGDAAPGAAGVALFGAEAVTVYAGAHDDPGSARNAWPGRVAELRPAGRLVEVLVDAGARVAALVTPGSLEALGLEPGAAVTVAVKATAVRIVGR